MSVSNSTLLQKSQILKPKKNTKKLNLLKSKLLKSWHSLCYYYSTNKLYK